MRKAGVDLLKDLCQTWACTDQAVDLAVQKAGCEHALAEAEETRNA